jgi:hypothetical protein
MHLSKKENRNTMLILDFITTSINAINLYTNGKDLDIALLNILDKAL